MLKTNTKENVKGKIIKILIILTPIITTMIFCNLNKANAAISSEIEEKENN